MNRKYYLDTCIWIDYFEDRTDNFRPLGERAFRLIKKILSESDLIMYSDIVDKELHKRYSLEKIQKLQGIIPPEALITVISTTKQLQESIILSRKLNIPKQDALHAILAKDNNAILISRDKHFYELEKQIQIKKPEDLI